MNKRKAVIKFAVICALVLVGILACFVSFRMPFTSDRYVGFVSAIESKMGIDFKGGVSAVFDIDGNPTTAQVDATVKQLGGMISGYGFDSVVLRQGTQQIRIEMSNTTETQRFLAAVGTPAELSMSLPDGEPVSFTKDDLKSVQYIKRAADDYGTVLNFTTEGGEKFYTLLESANNGGTIEIWVGDRSDSANRVSSPTVSNISPEMKKSTVISSPNKESAQALKMRIESGLFEIKLKPAIISDIPAALGSGALTVGIIAGIVILFLVFVLMYLFYGDMGLLGNLSLLVFMILFLFMLSVFEAVQFTLPGMVGVLFAIGMAVDANIMIFERIKNEFRNGKRMAVAVENGFNKTFKTILYANISAAFSSAVLYFLGTGLVKGFAITLFFGSVLSMICSLFITRSLAKTYLYINNNNEKKLRLNKAPAKNTQPEIIVPENKPRRRSLNLGGDK